MNWTTSNLAIADLQRRFAKLPARTKDNIKEYEDLAVPLRAEAIKLHYTRISICQTKNYE